MKSKTIRIIALVAVGIVAALLLPEIYSAGWRCIFGPSVAYRSWSVRPPFEWYATKKHDGMIVESMSHLPWRQGPMVFFQPVHFTKTYPFSYKIYGTEQTRALDGQGYMLEKEGKVQIAGEDGECWTFVSKTRLDSFWIACIVPKDLTSADYVGGSANVNAFGKLLNSITRTNSAE